MTGRHCAQCGRDISGKRRGAELCSNRCRKARRRGLDPQIIAAKPERGTQGASWPIFRLVAGPWLSAGAFHAATISDRDPRTGRSSWEEVEERNRRLLEGGQ
jgi:hypothetical protein